VNSGENRGLLVEDIGVNVLKKAACRFISFSGQFSTLSIVPNKVKKLP
jgi:hypothetical protein